MSRYFGNVITSLSVSSHATGFMTATTTSRSLVRCVRRQQRSCTTLSSTAPFLTTSPLLSPLLRLSHFDRHAPSKASSTTTTRTMHWWSRPLSIAAIPTTATTGTTFAHVLPSTTTKSWLLQPLQIQQQQRRTFAKDTMSLGITVTRKKGKETGYCYGCGADLVRAPTDSDAKDSDATTTSRPSSSSQRIMSVTPKKVGYWADQRNILKKAQIKNWALCPRCRTLNQYQKQQQQQGDSSTASSYHLPIETTEMLGPDPKMMEVFRREVSQIRQQEKAVVVLCIDAMNVAGTYIRTIRNYVGGNPILLAITRCDLLPPYVVEQQPLANLAQLYVNRCHEITPAGVYLCSEDPVQMHQFGGIKQLASDLWSHLHGRDPYIIGAANIGKSTLTDLLIAAFINRGLRLQHFTDRLAIRRVEKLRESRVTKSALPGTTLQNIRVPCFSDHKQALWDTPGLLLDESMAHFPIRNFRLIRAQRPQPIVPQLLSTQHKSFCIVITEKNDPLPLLRIEIRKRKNTSTITTAPSQKQQSKDNDDDGTVHLVWNSILDLEATIVDNIAQSHEEESERFKQEMRRKEIQREKLRSSSSSERSSDGQEQEGHRRPPPRTAEERKRHKEERKRAYEEKIRAEQEAIGRAEWYRQQAAKRAEAFEHERTSLLAKLTEVHQVIVEANVGMDITIANFGWMGLVSKGHTPTLIKTFAPNTGVRVVCQPTLALPPSFGPYKVPEETVGDDDDNDDADFGEDHQDQDDVEYDEYDEYDDEYANLFRDHDDLYGYEDENEGYNEDVDVRKKRWYHREKYVVDPDNNNKDPWAQWSGKYVGWQFDRDLRYTKGKLVDGWNPIEKDSKTSKVSTETDEEEYI